MLAAMCNAVKVESVPLNSNYFSGDPSTALRPGARQAARKTQWCISGHGGERLKEFGDALYGL
jgi:hypothetical protein